MAEEVTNVNQETTGEVEEEKSTWLAMIQRSKQEISTEGDKSTTDEVGSHDEECVV